mgnify:CR=1 FL=1
MVERKVRGYSTYSADALTPPAAGEGVAWLGRNPWAAAGPGYRLLRISIRSVGWIFGLRVRGVGLDRLASSGSRIRSRLKTTSSTVIGSPSWKRTAMASCSCCRPTT